jgi:regulatory protein
MPIITRISRQKRRARYNIEIDGEFAFGVSEIMLARNNLRKDKELSDSQIDKLKREAEEDKLYEKALRFLSYRPRSKREAELYLKRKLSTTQTTKTNPNSKSQPKEKIIRPILQKLEKEKYLDDREFARWWVEQRTKARIPKGERIIKSELFSKGIARNIIEEAFSDFETEVEVETETETDTEVKSNTPVLRAARARLDRYKGSDKYIFKRRMISFLLRRGFEWEEVKGVVDRLVKEL